MGRVQIFQRYEQIFQSVGEGAAYMAAPVGWDLSQPKEIIHKYVRIRRYLGVGAEEEGVTLKRGQGRI